MKDFLIGCGQLIGIEPDGSYILAVKDLETGMWENWKAVKTTR